MVRADIPQKRGRAESRNPGPGLSRLVRMQLQGRLNDFSFRQMLYSSTALGILLSLADQPTAFAQTPITTNSNTPVELDGSDDKNHLIIRGAILTDSEDKQAVEVTGGENRITLTSGAIIRGGQRVVTSPYPGAAVNVASGAELVIDFAGQSRIAGGRGAHNLLTTANEDGGAALRGGGKVTLSGNGAFLGGRGGDEGTNMMVGGDGGAGISLSGTTSSLAITPGASITVTGGSSGSGTGAMRGSGVILDDIKSFSLPTGAELTLFSGGGPNNKAAGGLLFTGTIADRVGGGAIRGVGGASLTALAVDLSGRITGGANRSNWDGLVRFADHIPDAKALLFSGNIDGGGGGAAVRFSSTTGPAVGGGEVHVLPQAEIRNQNSEIFRVDLDDVLQTMTIWNRGSLRLDTETDKLLVINQGTVTYVQQNTDATGVLMMDGDGGSGAPTVSKLNVEFRDNARFTGKIQYDDTPTVSPAAKIGEIIYGPGDGKTVTLRTFPLDSTSSNANFFMEGGNDEFSFVNTRITRGGLVEFDGTANIEDGASFAPLLASNLLPVFATGDVAVEAGTLYLKNARISGTDMPTPVLGSITVEDDATLQLAGRTFLNNGGVTVEGGGKIEFLISGRRPGEFGYLDLLSDTAELDLGDVEVGVRILRPVASRVFPLLRRSSTPMVATTDSLVATLAVAARQTTLYSINIRRGGRTTDDNVLGATGADENAQTTNDDIVAEVRRRPADALGVSQSDFALMVAADSVLGDEPATFDRLNNSDPEEVDDLIRDMRPNVSGGDLAVSLQTTRQVLRFVTHSMAAQPITSAVVATSSEGGSGRRRFSKTIDVKKGKGVSGAADTGESYRSWGRIGYSVINGSKRNGTAGYEGKGYQFGTGVDTDVTGFAGRARVGLSYAFASSSVEGKGRSATDNDIESHLFTIYSGVRILDNEAIGLTAAISAGVHRIDSDRHIDGFNRVAHSRPNAVSAAMAFEASYAFRDIRKGLSLEPTFNVDLSHLNLSNYDETGGGVLDHTGDNTLVTSIRAGLGGRVRYLVDINKVGQFSSLIGVSWLHDFDPPELERAVRFGQGPIVKNGEREMGAEEFSITVNTSYAHLEGLSFGIDYEGTFRNDENVHSFFSEMRYRF